MPRRSTLSATEREHLLALPESPEEFIRQYINLTGDYSWRSKRAPGKFQLLRPLSKP